MFEYYILAEKLVVIPYTILTGPPSAWRRRHGLLQDVFYSLLESSIPCRHLISCGVDEYITLLTVRFGAIT